MALELFKPFHLPQARSAGPVAPPSSKAKEDGPSSMEAVVWDNPGRRHPRNISGDAQTGAFRRYNRPRHSRLSSRFLVEGKGHPPSTRSSAPRFNADFDGEPDGSAHPAFARIAGRSVPCFMLSRLAQHPVACPRLCLWAVPSAGTWSSGIYYLTQEQSPEPKGEGRVFGATDEVVLALESRRSRNCSRPFVCATTGETHRPHHGIRQPGRAAHDPGKRLERQFGSNHPWDAVHFQFPTCRKNFRL